MPPVIAILGPTATGKTSLALHLAGRLGGEIINADALQVYRRLTLGTAKATPEEQARVPHHLVDILSPDESFSAGEFARRARAAIGDIESRRRRAFLVGGSGLYLRALLDGLSPIPEIPSMVRALLRRRLQKEGLEALRHELRTIDPDLERSLAEGDTQRVLRGLEVWDATSRTLTSWQAAPPAEEPISAVKIGLRLPRQELHERIALRTGMMVDQGWLEEVRELLASGLRGSEPAFQAIGYRELVAHLENGTSLEQTIERIVISTRQYAKRQMTWFKRDGDILWFDASDPHSLAESVGEELIGRLGLSGDFPEELTSRSRRNGR